MKTKQKDGLGEELHGMVTRRALVIAAVAVGIYLFCNGGPVFPGK